eukprot:218545-Pyramimonas_sp.AAC.1
MTSSGNANSGRMCPMQEEESSSEEEDEDDVPPKKMNIDEVHSKDATRMMSDSYFGPRYRPVNKKFHWATDYELRCVQPMQFSRFLQPLDYIRKPIAFSASEAQVARSTLAGLVQPAAKAVGDARLLGSVFLAAMRVSSTLLKGFASPKRHPAISSRPSPPVSRPPS